MFLDGDIVCGDAMTVIAKRKRNDRLACEGEEKSG